ncbi:glycosyltransferase [Parahaliea aestuarii]|uniref:Glycosyltransferase n=1 Tax=Parahaliea aestuarii TaxID=1852021 RepID=A0A5C8ZZ00_9GAMM|nr:glycosyltransferase [Parahaliea aestuarii]TXS92627.1 glycosyltransferase [Parahaliea aestuarii]
MSGSLTVVQALAGAPYGGAENFYTRLVCALAEQPGLRQFAFTRGNAERETRLGAAGVPVQTFRFGGPLSLPGHWRYHLALRKLAPDVVVTYMNRASRCTPAGDYRLVCRLGHYYDLKYYRHADHWVGITRGICDHLVRGGMPAARVHRLPNFAAETTPEPVAREHLNTPPGVPLLLSAGRTHRNKGFDILLRALVKLPGVWLWLAGDGPERAALENLSRELGIADRVRFLGWRQDVDALMRSADAFVCPSRHEGLGSIVLEAWYHRCPIVATRSQGPRELIEDGTNGLLCPVDQVAPLAARIRELLAAPAAARRLADAGSDHYRQYFSRATVSGQYRELLFDIAATPGVGDKHR